MKKSYPLAGFATLYAISSVVVAAVFFLVVIAYKTVTGL